jgi:hypothetical protein
MVLVRFDRILSFGDRRRADPFDTGHSGLYDKIEYKLGIRRLVQWACEYDRS